MQHREPTKISTAGDSALLPVLALFGANAALAFGPWFVRIADTGPIATGFWRITLAVPLLFAMAQIGGWRPRRPTPALAWTLIASGIAFAVDLASWHLGILRTTLANATLFGNSATLFYPIYGFVIARSLPTRQQGLALALAAIGAVLLMGRSYELSSANLAGDALCLFAGIVYTAYFILMARARSVLAPLPALALTSLASVAPLLIFALAAGERIWPQHWGPLVGLALVSQVVGQGLMIYALGRLPPLVVGIALLTQPIIAGAIGWAIYREQPGAADLIGAAMVAAALVLVRRRVPKAPPLAPTRPQATLAD